MKRKTIITALAVLVSFQVAVSAEEKEPVFSSFEDKKEFAMEVTGLIEDAWTKWQNEIIVNNVEVNGGMGRLAAGALEGEVLTEDKILLGLKRKAMPKTRIKCFKAVAGAVADCMRPWQREYRNDNIPFPGGSSSSFSLTPCVNVPVSISSGFSPGERKITESALYDYMFYRSPFLDEDVSMVFRSVSKAFCVVFQEWKDTCFIEGITASGGVAPTPAPMGTGPGPVRGAKGYGGRLVGKPFDGERMAEEILLVLLEEGTASGQ